MPSSKESGADVVLKVEHFAWSTKSEPTRFSVLDAHASTFRKVNEKEYQSAGASRRYAFEFPRFVFSGKLVDVESTDVIGTFDMTTAANWNLPEAYVADLELDSKENWQVVSSNFKYDDPWWMDDAKRAAEDRVIAKIA